MRTGPKGEKRPRSEASAAVRVGQIATGEIRDTYQDDPQALDKSVFSMDNLHVLRAMNSESVDLIYLDPPFNSNEDYAAPIGSEAAGAAFKDTWTLSDVDLLEHNRLKQAHIDEDKRNKQKATLYALTSAAGKAHSKGMFSYLMMMAPRLIEMKRVLKPTGSIWLHCDDAASHYLKILMDGIFGRSLFRADVSWVRQAGGKNYAQNAPGRIQDRLLFYGDTYYPEAVMRPHDKEETAKFNLHDSRYGRYKVDNLTAPGLRTGVSGSDWRGYNPTNFGRHWAVPKTGALAKWIEENAIPKYTSMAMMDRLDALDAAGLIHWPKKEGGWPTVKRVFVSAVGIKLTNLWDDVSVLARGAKERVGYPTQKPLALLERIIRASSKEGDLVLDPFCGCATTLVAAELLGRKWVGIDLSPLAARLVVQRIKQKRNLFSFKDIHHRETIPIRTDIERKLVPRGTSEHNALRARLYEEQGGACNLCHDKFPGLRHFHSDHILPRAQGGEDWEDNFQLLCGSCNGIKSGHRTMEEARAALAAKGGIDFGSFGLEPPVLPLPRVAEKGGTYAGKKTYAD